MSTVISISTRRRYGVARVCQVWGIAQAGIYRTRRAAAMPSVPERRPRPEGPMPDVALLEAIQQVLTDICGRPVERKRDFGLALRA